MALDVLVLETHWVVFRSILFERSWRRLPCFFPHAFKSGNHSDTKKNNIEWLS